MKVLYSGVIKTDNTYHGWPTVALTKDGRLLAAASGNREGHICPMGRLRLYTSNDLGKTWDSGVQLSNGPLDDRDGALCVAADGSVLAAYFTSTYALMTPKKSDPPHWETLRNSITISDINREHGFWMRRSTDGGKTWSEKYPVPVSNPHGPTLLSDGTLFIAGVKKSESAAFQSGGYTTSGEPVAAVSHDNGLTWEIISDIPAPAGQSRSKLLELHGAEAPDGRIVVHIRNHNVSPVTIWQTSSSDGGKTWSEPHYVSNGFPSFLTRLSGNRLLMSYSYRQDNYGVRARVSGDSGETWSEEIILYDQGMCRDLGYPSTVELEDGSLFTLWYENISSDEKNFSTSNANRAVLKYMRWEL